MNARDRLFLLEPEYADPDYPGASYYCRDCIIVEGLLAAFPERAEGLEIVRVPWPKPRAVVVEACGEENQNLPALAFHDGGFTNEIGPLLKALHTRHQFPKEHP